MSLHVGESSILSVDFLPAEAADIPLRWTSDNKDVAKVDDTGCVIAIDEGIANIIVRPEGESEVAAQCEVMVSKKQLENSSKIPSDKPGEGERKSKIRVSKITLSGVSKKIAAGKK